ncbi:MAG: TonB-dependent receptor, partial [Novosphingobium sp.]|nr:TonB-dependent receptor [Novosphingobium sp.]
MQSFRNFVLAGASLVAIAAPVHAQTASAADGAVYGDDAIIVEARRREENLQDVPLVVNAVTAETLNKLNIREFRDITSVVPGLSLTPNANGIGSSSSMRGVNHDVNASGNNGTIQYYYNDAPVASNLVLQTMFDIGQIEVLRGPQGTLRGKATPSGSITVSLRRPDLNALGAAVNATLASAQTVNLQAAFNVPVIEGKLGVRVAGLFDKSRGNRITSVNSSIEPDRESQGLRATVRAEPFDFLRAGFVFQTMTIDAVQFDQMQSTSLFNPTAPFSSNAQDYGIITPSDRKSVMANPRTIAQRFKFYGWDAEVDFLGQSLIYVGSHLDSTFHPLTPSDTTNFFPALAPIQEVVTISDGTTHELRLQNKERVAGMFDYVVGYFRQTGSSEVILSSPSILRFFGQIAPGVTFPLPVAPRVNLTPIYRPPTKEKEVSIFGNITAHLGERTELSAGLRRISYDTDVAGLFISCTPERFATGACMPARGTNFVEDLKKTIYNVSLRHRFNDSIMVYAASGSSWRPPVRAIGNFSSAPTDVELRHMNLPPETSKSYEVGFKSDWLNRTLQFNATAYHQKFGNYPYRAATGVYYINVEASGALTRGQFNFVSAVPVKVYGIEAELVWRPSDRFNLASTVNYSTSKIGNALLACTDAFNNATGAIGRDGLPDVTVPTLAQLRAAYGTAQLAECPSRGGSATFLPKLSGSLQAEYTHPVSEKTKVYLRGLFSWRGKSTLDP